MLVCLKFMKRFNRKVRRYIIHTVVDGDKVGACVGLDDGDTDGDVEG